MRIPNHNKKKRILFTDKKKNLHAFKKVEGKIKEYIRVKIHQLNEKKNTFFQM